MERVKAYILGSCGEAVSCYQTAAAKRYKDSESLRSRPSPPVGLNMEATGGNPTQTTVSKVIFAYAPTSCGFFTSKMLLKGTTISTASSIRS